jgi:hypothetical protein
MPVTREGYYVFMLDHKKTTSLFFTCGFTSF